MIIQGGDLVCGDGDGVVVIERDKVAETLIASAAREADEAAKIAKIRAGERTVDIYNFGMGN